MMRTTAARALLRPLSCAKANTAPGLRFSHIPTTNFSKSTFKPASKILALTTYASSTSLVRSYASSTTPGSAAASNKLTTQGGGSPKGVQTEFGNKEPDDDDVDMLAGVRHDIVSNTTLYYVLSTDHH